VASPQATVVHNVDVMPHSDPSEIRAALVKQLYSPVRWQETMEYFAREGVTRIFECGPGKVLAPLIKRCAPAIETTSLTGPAEINAALATIGVIPHE
jgi:[acyl-carrier-protein] S-malonyltransferase